MLRSSQLPHLYSTRRNSPEVLIMSGPSRGEIVELEEQTWNALQHSGAALIPYLSHDAVMLFPMGMKVTATSKPNLKEVMMSDAFVPWKSYKMEDVAVTPLGSDAAVITYQVEAYRPELDTDDRVEPFKALISSIWRKDGDRGKWFMVLHQQTPFQDLDGSLG